MAEQFERLDLFTHLDAEHGLGVALQRAQQQAALGVPYADGAVVGADQQHAAGALLRRAQAAHRSRVVTVEHVQLLQSLTRGGEGGVFKMSNRETTLVTVFMAVD